MSNEHISTEVNRTSTYYCVPLPPPPINPQAFYRKRQIIGDKRSTPPIEPILPISDSQLYALIDAGALPPLGKISDRVSGYWGSTLLKILESLGQGGEK